MPKNFKRLYYVLFLFSSWSVASFADTGEVAESWEVSGRVRSVTMSRDFEDKCLGTNSSLGVLLHAEGEIVETLQVGATYIYADEVYSGHQSDLLSNNGFHLFNEAWMIFSPVEEFSVEAGRFISNGEIFRKDDSRQKPRAIEGLQVKGSGWTVGHALRMSNYLQSGDRWKFNDFEDVFQVEADSAGVTWLELNLQVAENLQVDLYDAFAWEITNLVGTRIQWSFSDSGSISVYARMEKGEEDNGDHAGETYGLAMHQKIGPIQLEPGVLSVHGDNMLFQETTTGFHHAVASSMIVYTCPFDGGANSLYVKATSKLGNTGIYVLGIYTEQGTLPFDAAELDVILKQPVAEQLELVCKVGLGWRDNDNAASTQATDLRLFATYAF